MAQSQPLTSAGQGSAQNSRAPGRPGIVGGRTMLFFEDVVIQDSIVIKTSPENIFEFLTSIVDDDSYRTWHNEDHVSFQWLKGRPWEKDSILYAKEYIHGKLHKLKFKITEIVTNQRIEYTPTSCFVRKFFPKNEFIIEPKGDSCRFIAKGTYRIGKIGKIFFKGSIEKALSSVKKHMREEGENLKNILETKLNNQSFKRTR